MPVGAAPDLGRTPAPRWRRSIRALLEARLDRLSDAERAVTEAAAVIGKEFGVQQLHDLRPDDDPDTIGAALETLVRRDMIHLERVTRPHGRVYRFHHILLRDVAYGGTPKEIRARDHERFGDALERRAGDRITEIEEIVGYHVEAAHDLVRELDGDPERIRSLGERAASRLSSAVGARSPATIWAQPRACSAGRCGACRPPTRAGSSSRGCWRSQRSTWGASTRGSATSPRGWRWRTGPATRGCAGA